MWLSFIGIWIWKVMCANVHLSAQFVLLFDGLLEHCRFLYMYWNELFLPDAASHQCSGQGWEPHPTWFSSCSAPHGSPHWPYAAHGSHILMYITSPHCGCFTLLQGSICNSFGEKHISFHRCMICYINLIAQLDIMFTLCYVDLFELIEFLWFPKSVQVKITSLVLLWNIWRCDVAFK